ncbi:MAG: anti-sigma factor [Dehalococcoidia bacterium]|nr:anti-sigma factor [Dehalococcoidia bacterium]
MTPQPAHPVDYLPELALGVLPEDEAGPIRRHLADCQPCAEEYAELTRVAALLPLAADAPGPSPETRAAVLAAARRTSPSLPAPWRLAAPAWAVRAAAAVLLLAAGAGLGWLAGRDRQDSFSGDLAARNTLLADAARGETLRAAATSSSGIQASVLLAPRSGLAVAVLDGLPPPPPGRTYQAWLIAGGVPQSAGLFAPGGPLILAPGGDLRRFAAFAVTLEAEGGAPAPTTEPLVVVPFALAVRR